TGAPAPTTINNVFLPTNAFTGSHTDLLFNVTAAAEIYTLSLHDALPILYSYLAVYSGNGNYTSKTAACEPFKVNQATPTLVTTVNDRENVTIPVTSPARLRAAVHDTTTLGGAVGSFKLGDGTTAPPVGST